jgi:SAM-dependent methyltransferase
LFRQFPEIGAGVGVDPDLPDPAPTLPNVRFCKGLFPAVCADEQPFDTIAMLAVLEHVPTDQQSQLAADCARFLKPSGHLVITVPSPIVDHVLAVLRTLRLIHGMSLEQHYGYDPRQTGRIFTVGGLQLKRSGRFQLGMNNLFVFQKN